MEFFILSYEKLNYIVIDMAKDNSYIIVGTNDRKYAMILSKTPALSDSVLNVLVNNLRENGF